MSAPFDYPVAAHTRKHGPQGYLEYGAYKPWLRDEFTFRCVYCLLQEAWEQQGQAVFSIDHWIPQSESRDLICNYDNLLYACQRCNSCRGNSALPLDPCAVAYSDQFRVHENGQIEPLTREAALQIAILKLNDPQRILFRQRFLRIMHLLQTNTDAQVQTALRGYMEFPRDLPNLAALRPPDGNIRPDGVQNCYFMRRLRGTLPDQY